MIIRAGLLTGLLLLMSATGQAEETDSENDSGRQIEYKYVDHYGYRYSYRTDDKGGTIEVTEPGANRQIFRQSHLQIAGCPGSDFAEPRALRYTPKKNENILAFCGDDGGVQPEMLFFKQGRLLAKLEYGESDPNLVWYPEFGSYLATTSNRETPEISGVARLGRVYEWRGDASGFRQIFNSHSYRLYLDAYISYKQNHHPDDSTYLAMIAALISTSKTSFVCSEMNSSPLSKLKPRQVKRYFSIIENHGYPAFDLTICKRTKWQ